MSLCVCDARCCEAGSGVVLSLSPSLYGRMPDAVTLARGCVSRLSPSVWMPDAVTLALGSCLALFFCVPSPACLPVLPVSALVPDCLPVSSPCVSQSLRSDARCCDAGSGACLPVSQSLRCCDAPKLPCLVELRCPRSLAPVGPRKAVKTRPNGRDNLRGKLKGRDYSVKKP